jgi:hypothetical protein
MNASIDFWLDELDTQITELSAEQLRALRAGAVSSPARSERASSPPRASVAPREDRGDRPTWTALAAATLA